MQGVAKVMALVRSGCGPLYTQGESCTDELKAAIIDAIDALEPHY